MGDYAYTLQGWLKGVNTTAIGYNTAAAGQLDMGKDGVASTTATGPNPVAIDAVGYALHYYHNTANGYKDYTPIGAVGNNPIITTPSFAAPINPATTNVGNNIGFMSLYNGNIGAMSVNLPGLLLAPAATTNSSTLQYNYRYDQLNRLKSMRAIEGLNEANNTWSNVGAGTPLQVDDYAEDITYDPNGNILSYKRNASQKVGAPNATNNKMDDLRYKYFYLTPANVKKEYDPSTPLPADFGTHANNQLASVADALGNPNAMYNDIGNQAPGNYSYDAIGNLTKDEAEGITNITWNVYGKIQHISKYKNEASVEIDYQYDASGNRISKAVTTNSGQPVTTIYVRDASGNVMSVYQAGQASINNTQLTQTEIHLYGSSRLGMINIATNMYNIVAPVSINLGNGGKAFFANFTRANKLFELTNHLGNVLVTVSDKKLGVSSNGTTIDYYNADVVTANDYYPGGMTMPGRKYEQPNSNYRYGFNGQEKSDDVIVGNTTAEFWEYDSRIMRRWNIDPKPNVAISPYNCFGGNPIWFSDKLGDSVVLPVTNNVGGVSTQQNLVLRSVSNGRFAYFDQATNIQYNGTNPIITANINLVNNGFINPNAPPIIKQRFLQMQGDNIVHNINTSLNLNGPAPGVVIGAGGAVTQTNTNFTNVTYTTPNPNTWDGRMNLLQNNQISNGTADYRAQFAADFLSNTYLQFTQGGTLQPINQTPNAFFESNNSIHWLDNGNRNQTQNNIGAPKTALFYTDRVTIENTMLKIYDLNLRKYFVAPSLNAAGNNLINGGNINITNLYIYSTNFTPGTRYHY